MQDRRRLPLAALAASLLLGLSLTIALSWGCALWSPLRAHTFRTPPAAGEHLGLRIRVPRDWTVRTWLERRGPGMRHDTISECEWMGSTLGASPSTAPNRTLIGASFGWPLPTMQWTEYDSRRPALSLYDIGIAVPGTRVARRAFPKPGLPLRPIWPGFALHAAAFTALAGAALVGLPRIRRAHRRGRGRCIACGYTLAGLANCPECGLTAAP